MTDSAAAGFYKERSFDAVFDDAFQRMHDASNPQAYVVLVLETAGTTLNVFDYDAQRELYRHHKLLEASTVPLNRETGSNERTRFYKPCELEQFRADMMLATRSALQNTTIQYRSSTGDSQLHDTHFPLANITYPKQLGPLPMAPHELKQLRCAIAEDVQAKRRRRLLLLTVLGLALFFLLALLVDNK